MRGNKLNKTIGMTCVILCGVAEGAVKISCDYPGGNVKVVDVKP